MSYATYAYLSSINCYRDRVYTQTTSARCYSPFPNLTLSTTATRSLLLVPVTLCLLLLVLPAQSKEDHAVAIFCGIARCKGNPSRTINNATLHVTINGTTLATGKTTSTGRFLMTAKVTSNDQLIALVSKKAVITAPPQACGVPAADAAARKLQAAPADLNVHGIIRDSIEENPFIFYVRYEDIDTPDVSERLKFVEINGLDPDGLLNGIDDFLGIPHM